MILAHFTGNDTSSFLLVTGIALVILGARMLRQRGASARRRAIRMVFGGGAALAAGIAAGVGHTTLTSPSVRRGQRWSQLSGVSSRRSTFPMAFLGMASTKCMSRGTL